MVNQRLDNASKGGGVGSDITEEFTDFFIDVGKVFDTFVDRQQSQNKGDDKNGGNDGYEFDGNDGNDGNANNDGNENNDGNKNDDGSNGNDGSQGDGNKIGNIFGDDKTGDGGDDVTTSTTTPTELPIDGDGFNWREGGLYIALAVVVGLLTFLVADTLRRRKRSRRRPNPVAAVSTTVTAEDTGNLAGDAAAPAPAQASPIGAAVYQHIGAREDQQDSYGVTRPELYNQQGVLAVVADGMGGLANGKAVSSAIVRTFADNFPQISGYYPQAQDVLLDLTIRANAQVNQLLRGADRSGSTLVAALLRNGYLHFLTVGDSRIYLYRGGALLQLNREHIYQEELAVKAINQSVSMAQVRGDRQAHSLTSYVGIGRIPSIDRNDEGLKLVPGDRILMASDGVFGTLSQEQMEQALTLSVSEAAKTMGSLIREADKPYQDNNTLVILEYKG